MIFKSFEMVIQHFKGAHITILQRNKLELNCFPELDNAIDLLLHLSFILGNFTNLLNSVFVIEEPEIPEKLQLKIVVNCEVLFEGLFEFLPVSTIRGVHGVMLHVADERNKNTPSFDVVSDAEESVAFSILNLDRVQSSSHLFDFIFHLSQIHLTPFELQIVIESVLALFDVLPKLQHPSDLSINSFNYFLTAVGFTLLEFEHFFIINELFQLLLLFFHTFLVFFNFFETAFNSSIIVIEFFSLQVKLLKFQLLLEFLDFFFRLSSFKSFGSIDFFFNLGSNKRYGFIFFHQLHAFLHFIVFLLIISFIEGLESLFDSVKSQVYIISPFIKILE